MLRFPPKKILVPCDLSETSMQAWRHARALAKRFGAVLEAVYVESWTGDTEFFPPSRLTPALRAEILGHMRRKLGPDVKTHVFEGDPLVVILRLARTLRPDLIVMGTHGFTGLERAWRGSVAEAVVRLSPVPVLVARGDPRAIRSVLAPVNFTDYAEYGFAFAAAAASALGARLTALHVDAKEEGLSPGFALDRMVLQLPARLRARRIRLAEERGEPIDGILRTAAKHGLVVLVAHRKSLLKDMILGTTVERVLRHSPVPVLAVPAPKTPMPLRGWALSLPQVVVTK